MIRISIILDYIMKGELTMSKKVRFIFDTHLSYVLENISIHEIPLYKPVDKKSHNRFTRTDKTLKLSNIESIEIICPKTCLNMDFTKEFINKYNGEVVKVKGEYNFAVPMMAIKLPLKTITEWDKFRSNIITSLSTVKIATKKNDEIYIIMSNFSDNLFWKKIKI